MSHERCPTCNQPVRRPTTGIQAERVGGLHYLGRQVYRIIGHPGLWQMSKPRSGESESIMADSIVGKGNAARMFWRETELERRVSEAMRHADQ